MATFVLNPNYELSDADLEAFITASTDAVTGEVRMHFGPVIDGSIAEFIDGLVTRSWDIIDQTGEVASYHFGATHVVGADLDGEPTEIPCRVISFTVQPTAGKTI